MRLSLHNYNQTGWGPRTAWPAQLSATHMRTHSIAVQFLAQLSCSAMLCCVLCYDYELHLAEQATQCEDPMSNPPGI